MIIFFVNGQSYYSKDKFTVYDLLYYFDYNFSLLVVEYNNSISIRDDWNKITVSNDDKIEIITIVGGG